MDLRKQGDRHVRIQVPVRAILEGPEIYNNAEEVYGNMRQYALDFHAGVKHDSSYRYVFVCNDFLRDLHILSDMILFQIESYEAPLVKDKIFHSG